MSERLREWESRESSGRSQKYRQEGFFTITINSPYFLLLPFPFVGSSIKTKIGKPKNFIVYVIYSCDIMLGLENPGKIFLMIFPKAIVRGFIFVFHERTQENITSAQNIEFDSKILQ